VSTRAGHLVVEALVAQGLSRYTCVPGESFLPVLDAIVDHDDRVEMIVCRHESPAAHMAEAYGKLTGRPGVCFVTRGPGALHAAIGVHTADQDATPLILFIGQIARKDRGRGAFQEFNAHEVFGSMAKWVVTIDDPARIPETVARAVRIATSGRPGPVVIELPEDMLYESVEDATIPVAVPLRSAVGAEVSGSVEAELRAAQRPLLVLGRGGWGMPQSAGVRAFAEANRIPVVAGWRCQDHIDNESNVYIGHLSLSTEPDLRRTLEESDLIIAIGGHFGDVETGGYALLAPSADRRVIHFAADGFDLDRYVHADLAVQADSAAAVAALSSIRIDGSRWAHRTAQARAAYLERSTPAPDDELGSMIAGLSDVLPADAVVTNGAGNYAVWVHRFHRYRQYGTQLAPANGAMSYGLPAGIMAATLDRTRPTVVFGGDGCFLMSSMELATVAARGVPVVMVVVNNSSFGTIRMHQEREFPGRPSATTLGNPDFAALAQAHGIPGVAVRSADDFRREFADAVEAGVPRLIEVITDVARISPARRITEEGLV
jgi:acetolactate synthase-1/2/3 large subunit